jgi:hypothetical protein
MSATYFVVMVLVAIVLFALLMLRYRRIAGR